ncbi:MAG TPA: hypothetical protein VLM79_35250 [Kofleriaceae bacterium]|nr:hypothetical protein [Kofleriaceae bacterium]
MNALASTVPTMPMPGLFIGAQSWAYENVAPLFIWPITLGHCTAGQTIGMLPG